VPITSSSSSTQLVRRSLASSDRLAFLANSEEDACGGKCEFDLMLSNQPNVGWKIIFEKSNPNHSPECLQALRVTRSVAKVSIQERSLLSQSGGSSESALRDVKMISQLNGVKRSTMKRAVADLRKEQFDVHRKAGYNKVLQEFGAIVEKNPGTVCRIMMQPPNGGAVKT